MGGLDPPRPPPPLATLLPLTINYRSKLINNLKGKIVPSVGGIAKLSYYHPHNTLSTL